MCTPGAWASCDEVGDAGLAGKGARLVWGGCRFHFAVEAELQ